MRVRKFITRSTAATGVVLALLGPIVAEATSSTRTLTNGCRITGANVAYGGLVSAGTTPRSNCLTVQVKLWASGGYVQAGYVAVPNNTTLQVNSSGTLSYSDHNATGDNNPTAYGFRLY